MALPLAMLAGAWILVQALYHMGWRLNLTRSMPLGFHHMVDATSRPNLTIPSGSLVEFCPPLWVTPTRFLFYEKGMCSSGGAPMFKRVIATEGDVVIVNTDGMRVNGVLVSLSGQISTVAAKQIGCFVMAHDEYWVYGEGSSPGMAAHSFDSRYIGAIRRGQILSVGV
ncbi:MAG: hypothetical protein RLY95_33 [Pseudomonadota bacterium]|jgi:conjugative transfer signal peptidase TraF